MTLKISSLGFPDEIFASYFLFSEEESFALCDGSVVTGERGRFVLSDIRLHSIDYLVLRASLRIRKAAFIL